MFALCTGISLYLPIIWLFPYIFLLFDCFKWALIDCIEKWRVHSELWQFQMGGREGGRVRQFYCFLISSYYLTVYEGVLIDCIEKQRVHSELWQFQMGGREGREGSSVLLFPYIFLLFDCFEWVFIDCIEKQRVHSELWQFQMGGGREGDFISFTQVNLKIWAPGCLGVLINKVFSLYVKTKNTSERIHIHLLRVSSESETVRKFAHALPALWSQIGLSGTHTILNFVQILESYCCIPEVLIIFVNCHSLMKVVIIFVILWCKSV